MEVNIVLVLAVLENISYSLDDRFRPSQLMLWVLNIIHPGVDAWPQSGWKIAIVIGLCSTTHHGDAPTHVGALLEGPFLSQSDVSVRM